MERRRRARRGEGRSPHKPQNGHAIREFRELRRWSLTELANEVGITKQALSDIEHERRPASREVLHSSAEPPAIDVRANKPSKATAEQTPATPPSNAVAGRPLSNTAATSPSGIGPA